MKADAFRSSNCRKIFSPRGDGSLIPPEHGPLADMVKLLPHTGGRAQTLIHRLRITAVAVKEIDFPRRRIRPLTNGDFRGTAIYHARVIYTEDAMAIGNPGKLRLHHRDLENTRTRLIPPTRPGRSCNPPTAGRTSGHPSPRPRVGIIDGGGSLTAVTTGPLWPSTTTVADSIIVRNGGIPHVTHRDLAASGALQHIHVQNGGTLSLGVTLMRRFSTTLDDGATVLSSFRGQNTASGLTMELTGGFTTFRRDIPGADPNDPNDLARSAESRIDADITGIGGVIIEVEQFLTPTDHVKFRQDVSYTGPTIVKSGRLEINSPDKMPGFTSVYEVYDGAVIRVATNKANPDADMHLFGSSSQLLLTEDAIEGDSTTVRRLILGGDDGDLLSGTAMPAGTYVVDPDGTLYFNGDQLVGSPLQDRIIQYVGSSAPTNPATFHVLIPEPGTAGLLLLGGAAGLLRRRRNAG